MVKLSEIFNKMLNLVLLTVYWLVLSLPIITLGAATTALYYTTQKVIKNDRGYVSGEFFKALKENFKTSTLCWIVHLIVGLIFADECYLCYQMWAKGEPIGWLWVLFLVLEILNVTMALFTLTYIARFADGVGRTLKNSLLIMLAHLIKALLQTLLLAVFVIAVIYFPPAILVAPAAYMLLSSYILEQIFGKYMSPEDVKTEQERNWRYQ